MNFIVNTMVTTKHLTITLIIINTTTIITIVATIITTTSMQVVIITMLMETPNINSNLSWFY